MNGVTHVGKPFEYSRNSLEKGLKESDDASNYSKYLSSNLYKSKLGSAKVSPHAFTTNQKSVEEEISYHSDASENFSQVNEAENYSNQNVPYEPPKNDVYSGLVKSPNLLTDESKKSFDNSKSKDTMRSFGGVDSVICKTHSHSTFPKKFKELDFNAQEAKGNVRLTQTFRNLQSKRHYSKDSTKVKVPTIRATTPSQVVGQAQLKKEVSVDKLKGSKTGRYNDKLKISFIGNKKFKLRNLSSISSSIVNKVPKSNISIKSRNRDSSANSSDFQTLYRSIHGESSTLDNRVADKTAKYKIIKKGYKTQRDKSKKSSSPSLKTKTFKKKTLSKNLKTKIEKNTIQLVERRASKCHKKEGAKTNRDTSLNKKASNVLSSLMNKLKSTKVVKGNKSRAHSSSSDYRTFCQYPKTARTNYQSFKRSVSRASNEISSSKKKSV